MLDPTPEQLEEIREITSDDPVLLTMAPERESGLSAFAKARELGFRVSIGHTNAPGHIMRRVTAGGSTGFTHLGNGCPAEMKRDDNILWRGLDTPGLTYSLIPDRWHVSPALFRILHRLIDRDTLYYDRRHGAAGSAPSKYSSAISNLKSDRRRCPWNANLAGPRAPINAILHAADMLRCDWQEIWRNYSTIPAQFAKLPVGFEPGARAEFVEIKAGPGNRIESVRQPPLDSIPSAFKSSITFSIVMLRAGFRDSTPTHAHQAGADASGLAPKEPMSAGQAPRRYVTPESGR